MIRAIVLTLLLAVFSVDAGAEVQTPASTLTRPTNTTPYAQNDLIASSATAGSIVVPSVAIAPGEATIRRVRLTTNVTTGWDAVVVRVRLWSAAPTYTNGDNGAYAVATGAAGYLGAFDATLAQDADGARGVAAPAVGEMVAMRGTRIYWDLQITSASTPTPISAQTFTLTAEVLN